jgi:hypothetical protein
MRTRTMRLTAWSWKLRFSTGSSRIRENSDSGLVAVPRETRPNSHEFGYAQLQRPWLCLRILGLLWMLAVAVPAAEDASPADTELPDAKPVPAMQVVPLPYEQASFQRGQVELTRYHFGPLLKRPFLYPVLGPAGRSLTRMGQPSDPHGHRHHYSVWISHNDFEGVSFWGDDTEGRIVTLRVEQYQDGGESGPGASMLVSNAWRDAEDRTLLLERRRITVEPGTAADAAEDWTMTIDLEFSAPGNQPVTFGQTPFGMIGVRMAKSIGVSEGGGRILNSEGQRNEAEMFRKPARWVDYSGPVTDDANGRNHADGPSRQPESPGPVPRPRHRLDGRLPDARRAADHRAGPAAATPLRPVDARRSSRPADDRQSLDRVFAPDRRDGSRVKGLGTLRRITSGVWAVSA